MWVRAKEIIHQIHQKIAYDSDTYALFDIWKKETGKLSKYVELVGKKGKILLVKVDSSTYYHEVMLRKKELLNKINQHYCRSQDFVDNIKRVID